MLNENDPNIKNLSNIFVLAPNQAIPPIIIPGIEESREKIEIRSLNESILGGTFDNLHAGHKVYIIYFKLCPKLRKQHTILLY